MPRKTAPVPLDADAEQRASMRPRPDAAENDEAAWVDDLGGALLQ